MRSLAAVVVLAALLGACKDQPHGVAVTEAPPVGLPSAPGRFSDGDTTYAAADSAVAFPDTLAAADSLVRASVAAADSTPDFDAFWSSFRAAVRSGRRASVEALSVVGPGGMTRADWAEGSGVAFAEPYRAVLLALEPRDLDRDGAARVATAIVGYDAEGGVVPQDEADVDSAVVLRFEIVENAWRLVRIALAG